MTAFPPKKSAIGIIQCDDVEIAFQRCFYLFILQVIYSKSQRSALGIKHTAAILKSQFRVGG